MEQLQSFFPLILLFMVIYLFMIRPQVKKQKQEKNFVGELKKGAKVITKSGMHAKVLDINQDGTCLLETSAGKMKFEISAISMDMSKKLNSPEKKK
ncbi:MAG: preprotein translocase subunit YajC [Flavobacteriaceae bacterium]|jgi:preprotein translocase subunit YajC|nr:preprotein translocase subunit YajC [Flavobacteriaceae bacterium]MDG1326820.1 preprotein translocase subunit YajC [Flavobacteriaceae bacterium]MDG1790143.1 preprotein translocase subunit YajC [Flavobacteriaceae bacterium]MDG2446383.1 preprotein translocase subunit YajC [Flavobacteriaceae bacterium]|tara:strand:- start:13164 stop:13451 length:288 start_codon:yes stop_codon:yes gene_type:complete